MHYLRVILFCFIIVLFFSLRIVFVHSFVRFCDFCNIYFSFFLVFRLHGSTKKLLSNCYHPILSRTPTSELVNEVMSMACHLYGLYTMEKTHFRQHDKWGDMHLDSMEPTRDCCLSSTMKIYLYVVSLEDVCMYVDDTARTLDKCG